MEHVRNDCSLSPNRLETIDDWIYPKLEMLKIIPFKTTPKLAEERFWWFHTEWQFVIDDRLVILYRRFIFFAKTLIICPQNIDFHLKIDAFSTHIETDIKTRSAWNDHMIKEIKLTEVVRCFQGESKLILIGREFHAYIGVEKIIFFGWRWLAFSNG